MSLCSYQPQREGRKAGVELYLPLKKTAPAFCPKNKSELCGGSINLYRSNSWETKLIRISVTSNPTRAERWTSQRRIRRTKADRARISRILPGKTRRKAVISRNVKTKVPIRKSAAHHSCDCGNRQTSPANLLGIFASRHFFGLALLTRESPVWPPTFAFTAVPAARLQEIP